MTKQANVSKQTVVPTFPEKVREDFERILENEPVTSAYYVGKRVMPNGTRCVPTFKVNQMYYVYVLDLGIGFYDYEKIPRRQGQDKKFDQKVRQLMNTYGFMLELGEAIINATLYPSGIDKLCERIEKVRKEISTTDRRKWKERFKNNPQRTISDIVFCYGIIQFISINPYAHNNPNLYNSLEDYLFATN